MNWNGGAADNGSLIGLKAAGQQNFNRTFTYDALGRVTQVTIPVAAEGNGVRDNPGAKRT